MVYPDAGFLVKAAELLETVTVVSRAGSDLSTGLQDVRDWLMLPSATGLGWEVDAPLAQCANEWVQQMHHLTAVVNQAAENLGRNAQSYQETDDGVCSLPEEEL